MHHFTHKNNILTCENVPIPEIASKVGTPFYLYSTATLTKHFLAFDESFKEVKHLTCFAVKSCSNLAVLRLFANNGGGADIVSGGELFRALKAGIAPEKIVYSGVGKSETELAEALKAGILMFNVESVEELVVLQRVSNQLQLEARVSFRINPDVDPKTHAYISTGLAKNKFGISVDDALEVYQKAMAMENIRVVGVSCHIGSQLTQVEPFIESLQKIKAFISRLADSGISISYLDLGGGLGINYDEETPPHPEEYGKAIARELKGLDCTLILEPGRVIAGNAGILVTKVLYTKKNKQKKFTIVDAGMNDLARPSLYDAFHAVWPVKATQETEVADIVGPICETGDFLSRGKEVPCVSSGDLIAVMSSGAYGFTMSSNYNSRPRVAEVLVHDDKFDVIRERESYETLIRGEKIPSHLQNK
jgi:diaminopimelate decarboxylase